MELLCRLMELFSMLLPRKLRGPGRMIQLHNQLQTSVC